MVRTAPQTKLSGMARMVVVTACSRLPLRSGMLAVRGRAEAHAEQQCAHQCDQNEDLKFEHVDAASSPMCKVMTSVTQFMHVPQFASWRPRRNERPRPAHSAQPQRGAREE